MTPAEDFGQLRLKFTDPVQHHYEVIRPIVLFSETISERSRQTGVERTRVGEKAKRFVQQGMFGLVDQRTDKGGRKPHEYPEPVAAHILYLKQLYPPIHYREIVRILERKFGYQTNHHTVKRFLERYAIPVQLELDFPVYLDFEDAYQARWTVVQMYYQEERADGRQTPISVLAWCQGRTVDPKQLQRLFQSIRFDRTVNRYGFVSIQRFYLYAEQGLSRKRVAIWIYEGKLQIEYQQTMLAKYACDYDQHQKQLQNVSQPTLFQTPFKSPQLVLFALDDVQWLKIRQRVYHRQQKRLAKLGQQLPLLRFDIFA